MSKFVLIAILLNIPSALAFARTCTEIFNPSQTFYRQGTDIQRNVLDTAEFVMFYPENKFANSTWFRFAVHRMEIHPHILQISPSEIENIDDPLVRTYVQKIQTTFFGQFNPRVPANNNEIFEAIEKPQILVTVIFDKSGNILAGKITYRVRVARQIELNNLNGLFAFDAYQQDLLRIYRRDANGYFNIDGDVIKMDSHF